MSDRRQRAALVERAARAGGAVARDAFRGSLDVRTKASKNDLVTDADIQAQRQVVHTISQAFPDEAFVCEESPPEGQANGPTGTVHGSVPETGACWVVDPIDGTANFVRGIRLWGTAVTALRDGDPVAAATYLPALQDIYTAGPDSATRNGNTLAVSARSDPETFAVGLAGYWPSERAAETGALATAITRKLGDSRRFGSTQATLGFVASGELDAAVNTEPVTPWDTIAGVYLVRQAGGVVTDLDGEPWTLDSGALVASNGEAHAAVLDSVRTAIES